MKHLGITVTYRLRLKSEPRTYDVVDSAGEVLGRVEAHYGQSHTRRGHFRTSPDWAVFTADGTRVRRRDPWAFTRERLVEAWGYTRDAAARYLIEAHVATAKTPAGRVPA